MNTLNEIKFRVAGGFDISTQNEPLHGANGDCIGYTLPDGSIIRLVVALERETPMGEMEYITSEHQMSELGFSGLDYDELTFDI